MLKCRYNPRQSLIIFGVNIKYLLNKDDDKIIKRVVSDPKQSWSLLSFLFKITLIKIIYLDNLYKKK